MISLVHDMQSTFPSMFRLSLVFLATLITSPMFAGHEAFRGVEPSDNVNYRYTVERVDLMGYQSRNVSRSIRQRLNSMIGRNLDSTALNRIALKIRDELRVDEVHIRIGKGTRPQHVAVQLEIEHHRKAVDFNLSRIGYTSGEGVTVAAGIETEFAGNRASMSFISDGDQFIERASGFQGGFARTHFTRESAVGFRVGYGALSEHWSRESLTAFAGNAGAVRYGFRQYVEPEVLISLTPELQLTVGASVEHLENVESPAARTLASNALTTSLRYKSRFEGTETLTQDVDALYTMRMATRGLGSDFVYTRHSATINYALHHLGQTLRFRWIAGLVNGNAPIYDRFGLGNSSTLRGWNKFALAPLGGSRIVHGSIEYRYRMFEAFYDVGAIWDRDPVMRTVIDSGTKHSVGVGIRKDALQLAVAFPLKNGRMDPVFLAGVNF